MTDNIVSPFTEDEWEILLKSPVVVFLLVASTDGQVDAKAVNGFINVLGGAKTYKSTLMRRVLVDTTTRFATVLVQILSASGDAGRTLLEAKNIVDAKLTIEEAALFKRTLLLIGKQIAEMSGGIGDKQRSALTDVGTILGLAG